MDFPVRSLVLLQVVSNSVVSLIANKDGEKIKHVKKMNVKQNFSFTIIYNQIDIHVM